VVYLTQTKSLGAFQEPEAVVKAIGAALARRSIAYLPASVNSAAGFVFLLTGLDLPASLKEPVFYSRQPGEPG